MKSKKKTIFVGLSGGVDSAVSAALLKKEGCEVVGVFMKTWHPDFLPCNEEKERRDAMRVAAHLDIPFLTFDFEEVYKKEVADYMIAEYKAGRTPNPDIMCNKYVKFGAFLDKALSMGADFVATGHYARVEKISAGNAFSQVLGSPAQNFFKERAQPDRSKKHFPLSLLKGKDPAKDQSYFLWTLTQKQLSKILFPVGHLPKPEVRKVAKKIGLPVSEKKDSQGICFLGEVDLKKFLKHYIKEKKGKVLRAEDGAEIGYHDGTVFSTLGERHGFTITKKNPNDGPYYIVSKDLEKNVLIVSSRQGLAQNHSNIPCLPDRQVTNIRIRNINWVSDIPEAEKKYTAQIRYHGEFLPCKIECKTPDAGQAVFDRPVLVAPGQSLVLYDQDVCLGGGIVR